jgi:hypothetical protein
MTDTTRQADALTGAPEMPAELDALIDAFGQICYEGSTAPREKQAIIDAVRAYGQAMAEHARRVALEEGFEAGWRVVARDWAMRDDLLADIGSPAYLADMTRAIRAAAQQKGKQ